MPFAEAAVIVIGLAFFEAISSIDNAVVNADALAGMSEKARHWFLRYGLFIAVVLVRGLLPFVIVWASNPSLGAHGAIMATFSADPRVRDAVERQKPILLAGGGVYLLFLFLHWLFVEDKEYAFFLERHIHQRLSFWFYATASLALLAVVWMTVGGRPLVALGAVVGSTAFFITDGFKSNAERKEQEVAGSRLSDISKLLYLEMLDATFSVDGVLGAFAFTLSVPLILLGNGLGAWVVRWFTVHGAATIRKYRYLKNGAMYSILALAGIMLAESFQKEPPVWLPTAVTIVVVGVFFWLSVKELRMRGAIKE